MTEIRSFLIGVLIGLLILSVLLFVITGCDNDNNRRPIGPHPDLVIDADYNGVVVLATHGNISAVLDVIDLSTCEVLDSVDVPPGDYILYHDACPGDYRYVLSPALPGLFFVDDAVAIVEVPLEDYPVPEKPADKVLVCHNGKTICVSDNAVEAHLNHGDLLGPCEADLDTPKFERKYPCVDGGLLFAE